MVKTPEKALDMADASDARRAKGEAGLLDGAPLGIKDLYCTKGVRTTMRGSRLGAPDLVERDFTARAADELWVADITYSAPSLRRYRG